MSLKKSLSLQTFLIIFSATLALATPINSDPVKIGCIFCLTGEIASGCNAIREGAEVAVDLVNAMGGVQGRPLVLDIQDSHYTPRDAHGLAVKFSSDKSIIAALITGIVETKAAAQPFERAKMSYLTLWDSAPSIEALGDYSFGIGPWLPSSYELSAEFAFNKLKKKKAAIIATTAEWSLTVAHGFKSYFKGLGGDVVSSEEALPQDSDFRVLILRMLKAKPDVIYAPITSNIIPFFKQLRELGFNGPVITSDNITDELISQSQGVFEGLYQTMVADPESKEAEQLATLFQRKFNRAPTMIAFNSWGYDGVRLVAEALKRSPLTRESVRAALLSIKEFPGAGGKITFSTEGSWRMPLKVFFVKQGRLIPFE